MKCEVDNCKFQSTPNSTKCPKHGGAIIEQGLEKQDISNYKLLKYRQRIKDKTQSSSRKTLHEEVGILRIILEERINQIQDDQELLIYSGEIGDMILKIEKLVQSAHKLDVALKEVVGADVLAVIADNIINILSEHVAPEVLTLVADKIEKCLTEQMVN